MFGVVEDVAIKPAQWLVAWDRVTRMICTTSLDYSPRVGKSGRMMRWSVFWTRCRLPGVHSRVSVERVRFLRRARKEDMDIVGKPDACPLDKSRLK